jgi:hypothetical protein
VPYVTAVIAVNHQPGLRQDDDDPFTPKQRALAMLNVKGLSGQGLGAGLVQAPDSCGSQAPLAGGGWMTSTVQAVSGKATGR